MSRNNGTVLNDSTVKNVSARASDVAQSTISTVQDSVQTGLEKTQDALQVAMGMVQGLMERNTKRGEVNLKKTQGTLHDVQDVLQERVQSTLDKTQHILQAGTSKAQATLADNSKRARKGWNRTQKNAQKRAKNINKSYVQPGIDLAQGAVLAGADVLAKNAKNARKGWNKAQKNVVRPGISKTQEMLSSAQDVLETGAGVAAETLAKNAKSARKNWKKAEKNLKHLQSSVQDTAENAQDVLAKNAKLAGKGLKKMQKNLGEVQGSLQDRLEHTARKRKQAKLLFRVGLLTGIVLALLYAPRPGAALRSQLLGYWNRLTGMIQERTATFNHDNASVDIPVTTRR